MSPPVLRPAHVIPHSGYEIWAVEYVRQRTKSITRRINSELRHRNVFRVAAAYAVLAWLIIEVVETIFPAFGFGNGAIRVIVGNWIRPLLQIDCP